MYNSRMPVTYETESPPGSRGDLGPYREADYLALPDEPRCELLYGRLLVMGAPTLRHQRVVGKLYRILSDLADRYGDEAFVSPVDVAVADHSIVQPDVIYVTRARSSMLGARVDGAPDLVVEVLSPGSARRDLGEKLRLYAEFGVTEYWVVDASLGTFEFLQRDGDGFRLRLPEGTVYRSSAVVGIEIDLDAFWRAIPEL